MNSQLSSILRILFYSVLFLTIPYGYLSELKDLQLDTFCAGSSGVYLPIDFSADVITASIFILQISLVFSAVGFLTRISQWSAFFSLVVLNMNQLKSCYNNFALLAVVIPLFIWAVLDNFTNLRIDHLISKKSNSEVDQEKFLIYSLQTYFCIIFFLSGVTKLKLGGLDWIFSDSLKNIFLTQNFTFQDSFAYIHFHKFQNLFLYYDNLFVVLALVTVILELATPVALFSERTGKHIILHLLAIQIGIYFFMYIDFFPWIVFYLIYPFYYKIRFRKERQQLS